ncbi:MAG: helix-turn-helix transcriptional regulator [Burkholderiales bacterium]|nr:helix-turn-helix transcriptional regulator [Burkholderiales bacterium]
MRKLGHDLDVARKKRRLTVAALCERAGISPPLYSRLVKGEPGTSIGACAAVLFALGVDTPFEALLDAARDDVGLLLDEARLPKRVRHSRKDSAPL